MTLGVRRSKRVIRAAFLAALAAATARASAAPALAAPTPEQAMRETEGALPAARAAIEAGDVEAPSVRHLDRCCMDLYNSGAVKRPEGAALVAALEGLTRKCVALGWADALFATSPDAKPPLRMTPAEAVARSFAFLANPPRPANAKVCMEDLSKATVIAQQILPGLDVPGAPPPGALAQMMKHVTDDCVAMSKRERGEPPTAGGQTSGPSRAPLVTTEAYRAFHEKDVRAQCLDREGDTDAAEALRGEAVRELHEKTGPGDSQSRLAEAMAARPRGSTEPPLERARRLEAAITAFEAAQAHDTSADTRGASGPPANKNAGLARTMTLFQARLALLDSYTRAGDATGAARTAAEARKLAATLPRPGSRGPSILAQIEALEHPEPNSRQARSLRLSAALASKLTADRARALRELDGARRLFPDELLVLATLAQSAGKLGEALEALEALASLLAPGNGPPPGVERLMAPAQRGQQYARMLSLEGQAWTLLTSSGLARPLDPSLGIFLSEARKARMVASMLHEFESTPETHAAGAETRYARATRAAKMLAAIADGRPLPSPCDDPQLAEVERLEQQRAVAVAQSYPARAIRPAPAAPSPALQAFTNGLDRAALPRGVPRRFVDGLAATLPNGARFVGYVRYEPWRGDDDPLGAPRELRDAGQAHYLAYVVGGKAPFLIDLGPAREIDPLIAATVDPGTSARPLAPALDAATLRQWRTLHDRVWAPLAPALAGASRVWIAADDMLQMLAFAALHDGRGWLYERLEISQVHSARDLLPADASSTSPSAAAKRPRPPGPPLIFANPPAPPSPGHSRWTEGLRPLPGAAAESTAVAKLWPGSRLLAGADAEERVLLTTPAPLFLHIAGHAFAQPSRSPNAANSDRGQDEPSRGLRQLSKWNDEAAGVRAWRRLERSLVGTALVLAAPPEAERAGQPWDGFATGYEIVDLDLHGTELVTLSGCGTGTGELTLFHDPATLQQAFLIAGAKSVLASLWSLHDAPTKQWMGAFYTALRAGRTRTLAMREAMTAVRARTPDPRAWAGFALFGEAGPLAP